jgi:hypothetical protein
LRAASEAGVAAPVLALLDLAGALFVQGRCSLQVAPLGPDVAQGVRVISAPGKGIDPPK